MKRGVVSSRVALLLRSTETQPQLLDLKQNSSSISFSFLIPVKIILEGIHKRNPTDSHQGPGEQARARERRQTKERKKNTRAYRTTPGEGEGVLSFESLPSSAGRTQKGKTQKAK